MNAKLYSLAIETSGRVGSFAFGDGGGVIETVVLPPQTGGAGSGGSSELMAQLEALCGRRGVRPAQIGAVYLSIGPGSFTGLRIGVTIAKMLAKTLAAKVVAVPTLDVLAQNAPPGDHHVAACLNLKKETVYCGVFGWREGRWRGIVQPKLRTMEELLAIAPRPVVIVGDPLPAIPAAAQGVAVLPVEMARARAEVLFELGREDASAGRYVDVVRLTPLYVRPPEAVELWDKRHGPADGVGAKA